MDTCDVLIVGGGPAGSACARNLHQAGLDVVVVDKARFPRDKVCAGWITPQVVDELRLDPDEYRNGRTFQPITGFRVGVIGVEETVTTVYDRVISFGIRRCEFDDYLLRRASARMLPETSISSIRRDRSWWIVNETIKTAMLVGAGGHFCPVARMLNGTTDAAPRFAAQEVEFAVDPDDDFFATVAGAPELYFCQDLKGYGWFLRKGNYVNVGLGRLDAHALPKAREAFVDFLKARHRIPHDASWRWRGHAYLPSGSSRRSLVGDGVLLVGDSAGLAYPHSGEGIRPAIESGLMAASAIVDARGQYTRTRLARYERDLRKRLRNRSIASAAIARIVPARVSRVLASRLLATPWFVRHILLERWFLHAHEPALAP